MRMTASVGIAVATAGASGAELMCDSATALLQAKDRGGGRAELFNGSIRRQLVARLWMESELRRGIEAGELALVYQPVIATHDRTLVGLEALVRWEHPEWDPVRPDRFLDVAERTELVLPMGAWVLREACAQLAAWSAAFPDRRAPKMSIDVSLRELAEPGYPGRVAAAAEAAGMAPDQLVLELAASRLTPDSRSPVVALEELSSLGVRLFLDDFGTGSFSLTDLRRLPIDGLKIALPPPSERGDDERARSIVEATVGMARSLGLEIVATAVETEDQLALVEELRCPLAQGYLFSRPLRARALDPILASTLPHRGLPEAVRGTTAPAASHPAQLTDVSITLREAADALGVSPSTLRRWSDNGRIDAADRGWAPSLPPR